MKSERGVSPVIAAVILIAVTVIAAAGVIAYVATVGTPPTGVTTIIHPTPKGGDTDVLELRHAGGDTVRKQDLTIVTKTDETAVKTLDAGTGEFKTGDTISLSISPDNYTAGKQYLITIVHTPSRTRIFYSEVTAVAA